MLANTRASRSATSQEAPARPVSAVVARGRGRACRAHRGSMRMCRRIGAQPLLRVTASSSPGGVRPCLRDAACWARGGRRLECAVPADGRAATTRHVAGQPGDAVAAFQSLSDRHDQLRK